MQIIISAPSNDNSAHKSSKPEWVLIELQGTIEADAVDMRGLKLGHLEHNQNNLPVLTIGHHKLEGKIVDLPKPYAVIKRRNSPSPHLAQIDSSYHSNESSLTSSPNLSRSHSPNSTPIVTPTPGSPSSGSLSKSDPIHCDVVAVIRKRYLFKSRPEPIINDEWKGLSSLKSLR
ncbi:chromosome transmission fidelity protein 8 [Paraphysoderma sedebokerense]|nr:chromosome transmission fidelity protein 8 [Paraphysoderma sedebokerense]